MRPSVLEPNRRSTAKGAGAHNKLNTGQNQILPRALQLKRAAAYLDVSEMSMRRLIKRGLIKPNRALRHILIPVAELDRFLGQ
jgi:excisionase family DNA binding protein